MPFKPIYAFDDLMEGKTIRFRNSVTVRNLTNQFGISRDYGAELNLPSGALGTIYEVRGGTVFIGFGRNLKSAPERNFSPASYAATAQIHIDDSHLIEIEL